MLKETLKRQVLPSPLAREYVFERELRRYEKPEGRFDLVFGIDVFSFRPALQLAAQHGARTVLDINEMPNIHDRTDPVFKRIASTTRAMINDHTRKALHQADKVFVTGRTCVEYVEEFAGITPHAFINSRPSNIKTNPGLLRKTLKLSDDDLVIVIPNTAAPSYGVEETLKAMCQLPANYHLCFIGRFKNDEYHRSIKRLVSEYDLTNRVHEITGLVDQSYIKMISGGDVGIIPLDPKVKSHVYVSPARTYDLLAAELPMAFTKNNEMLLLNDEYHLGTYIPRFDADCIAQSLREILSLPYASFSRMKRSVQKAKADFDSRKADKTFPAAILDLLENDPEGKSVAMVCNNGIVNNRRVMRYLHLMEKMGLKLTLFCIQPPNERIWKETGLKDCTVVTIDIKETAEKHAASIGSQAAFDWSGDFLKLGVRKVNRDIILPRVNRVRKRTRRLFSSSSAKAGSSQLAFTKDFADKAYNELKSEKYDYVLSHDIFAFPAAERFMEKDNAPHILDITEIPDLSQRAGKNFREMPERYKKQFASIEHTAEQSSSSLYTFCDGMGTFLRNRYDRDVKTLLNARDPYLGEPDPFVRQKLGIPSDAIVLVANCTFSPESLPTSCINALKHMPNNVYLLFLGNATNASFGRQVMKHANRNKLRNRVRFHPPVYGERYLGVLAACDIGLNIFNTEFDQLRLILPNRVLDFVAASLPFVSSPMEDVEKMTSQWRNGIMVSAQASSKEIGQAVSKVIDKFGIHRGGMMRESSASRLDALAHALSWKDESDRFVSDLRETGDGKSVLFLARQRLHSNNRIFRQCRALNDAGLDVHLVGAREGPGRDLAALAPDTSVTVLEID